ncbi:uncharacterized protein N7479_002800 [Penicillium vulpinum]|uniref:uncharacterized protein n=1 Tax=Penicillium vulpinum TaxID=29845 RepID=UPI0025472B44|nr:uncharacterized protein N7479_002800 [Penicillium vulpinum]KAJ5972882.1 hypothetical protein N7479_002800 [Penicillium vulpinum]
MGSQPNFHLFGDCSIEAPSKEEFDKISDYIPLLNAFEASLKTRVKEMWDFGTAFKELVKEDTKVWKSLGVDRSPHFVQPSGSLSSALAIHLYNPNFFVADPQSTVTDDPTNPTIRLLYECGLSFEYCFMFDGIYRRERTDDCLLFYTEDPRRPHREFIQKIRENMSAAVEICLGEEVFKEIRKTARLDLAILMAIQLAGLHHRIKLKPNFFESNFVRGKYSRLSPKQDLERRDHLREALDAFRVAFPKKFKEFELRQSRRKEEKDLLKGINDIPSGSIVPMHTHPNGPISEREQEFRLNARNTKFCSIIASFEQVMEDMDPFHYEASDDYVESEIFDYGDIPTPLQLWLQSQDGLKIHGRMSNLNKCSAEYLACMVGIMYIRKITRAESGLKQVKAIPGEPGKLIHLKCSGCQRPVLDDAFPFFVADSPDCYFIEVARSAQKGGNGCGQNGCKGKPGLIPVDHGAQGYTRMETRAIAQTMRRKANWKAPLCRTGKDLEGCAQTVRVRCRGYGQGNQKVECGRERDYDTPEWTIHSPARLVQPRLKCDCDERVKDHYFEPVDKKIDMISFTSLRKIYRGFLKANCDLANYPKLPDTIFDLEPNGDPKKKQKMYRERFECLKNAQRALTGSN